MAGPSSRWWSNASVEVSDAWDRAIVALGRPSEKSTYGLIGGPGPSQTMVLVSADVDSVAKLNIFSMGATRIKNEYINLVVAKKDLGAITPSATMHEGVILIGKARGRHPRWDDPFVHEWILKRLLLPAGGGVAHHDITPWNVLRAGSTLTLIDWEAADFQKTVNPIHNLLDYVLRGAVVKREPARRVCRTLARSMKNAGITLREAREATRGYIEYRSSLCKSDALLDLTCRYANYIELVL